MFLFVSENGRFFHIVCLFRWFGSLWGRLCLYVSLVSENGRFINTLFACLVGLVMLN